MSDASNIGVWHDINLKTVKRYIIVECYVITVGAQKYTVSHLLYVKWNFPLERDLGTAHWALDLT